MKRKTTGKSDGFEYLAAARIPARKLLGFGKERHNVNSDHSTSVPGKPLSYWRRSKLFLAPYSSQATV